MNRGWARTVSEHSLLLIAGAAIALIWSNTGGASYGAASHAIQFAVNDVGMAFFFAIAASEVVHATGPGGPLSSLRQAGLPILAAAGGMIVPALIFLAGARLLHADAFARGWAIPCATDIAFSYLAARLIFPATSPAVPFLLLLAIADDALGLIVLAIFYPSAPLHPGLLAIGLIPALALAWTMRKFGVRSAWLYIIGPGVLSWAGLHAGGIHPALALVPIVPFMPAAKKSLEPWSWPVQLILFAFGLANAGVAFTSIGVPTWLVLGALLLGKPIGVVGMTLAAELAGFRRPAALDLPALIVLGVASGIGFTVALFFATAAYAPGTVLDQAKMGALMSLVAAPLALVLARVLRIRRTA